MKVFFPIAYFYPEQCAGIYVVDDVMLVLAKESIESYLSVPKPTRAVPIEVKWARNEILCDGKIHIHRFWMYNEGRNPFFRALRYLFCEMVQLHYMLWKDYDVAFIDSTPPIQGLKLPIVRLFRRKRRFVYNAQDLFPETLSGTGLAKKGGFLWKIGMWVSNVTSRNSDKIIAISEDIKRSLVARGVPEEKVEVVYNWVDEKAVHPVFREDNPLYEEFGIDRNMFTVVYAGNLGNAQNLGIIINSAYMLPDVQFVLFGTGGEEDNIRKKIEEDNLENIRLLPLQPVSRVSEVYSLGDACIVSCKAGFGGSAMPSKTWSIMACGRPVVASFDEGELKDILEKNDCGVFSHAENGSEFVAAIRFLKDNPDRCEEMGRNARKFILENLTKEVGTRKYVNIIKDFINQSLNNE